MVIGKEEEYANHLDNQLHLAAVTVSANRSKGAKGTENWQPPDEIFWYEYALYWTVAKTRRELTMTKVEAVAVIEMLQTFPTPAEVLEFKGGTRQPQESEPTEELQNSVTDRARRRKPRGAAAPREPSPEAGVTRRPWSRLPETGMGMV